MDNRGRQLCSESLRHEAVSSSLEWPIAALRLNDSFREMNTAERRLLPVVRPTPRRRCVLPLSPPANQAVRCPSEPQSGCWCPAQHSTRRLQEGRGADLLCVCERTLARTWKRTFRQDHAAEPAATYTKGGEPSVAAATSRSPDKGGSRHSERTKVEVRFAPQPSRSEPEAGINQPLDRGSSAP